jgi:glucosyl-3-phosphoglycerate synthase
MTDENRRVIIAGTTRDELANLLPFARVLAQAQARAIFLLGLVPVPEGESLSTGARRAQELRRALGTLSRKTAARTIVRVAHHPWTEVQAAVDAGAKDLLLVNFASALPERVLSDMPSDVVVVNGACPAALGHILLPIRGGPYAALSLEVALAFAQAYSAEITVLHAAPPELLENREYLAFLERLRALSEVTRLVNVSGDPAQAIIRRARAGAHQLVVMGAIAQPQPGGPPIGPTATRVMEKTHVPLLIVKAHGDLPVQPAPVDYTISVIVDKWFAENTFHAHEFKDIRRLVELKEAQGITISLGLPARDEEKTIGKIIRTAQFNFMRRYPLLDEIVVIDSDSTDRTAEIARALGVPVYRHRDILPTRGTYVGKGEALWKSLYVLKGNMIAWIDTDILNIHPRFVYGILGPLIKEPRLMYVKGFYQRPLRLGRHSQARGGGRVTEIAARPLLNLFYPELSGMVQPLAGEYAGRREALERVPFFTGYGVEAGLLIDLADQFGLRAIGQVDLEERAHRNRSLFALSQMAFAIIQVVLQRVGAARGVKLLNDLNKSMKLIHYTADEFHLQVAEIRDFERPPIITLAEYRQKRAALR